MDTKEAILIRNAYENNLKHLDLEIPLNTFVCVTGCSGSGKSSLVFNTIYAESQRAMLDGMTGNSFGQKLMSKPHVGTLENLRPALSVSQNSYNVNPRSTVGTLSEVTYYLRSLFALINSIGTKALPEQLFSSNNPKAFCPHCRGLGTEMKISETLLIPDPEVTLRDGAVLFFKGPLEGKEQKYLEALCEHYQIDINKKVPELSPDELHIILYAQDPIEVKLSYKEGKRRKKHNVILYGAIPAIQAKASLDSPSASSAYAKYLIEVPCSVCKGSKLRSEILQYQVNGMNYDQLCSMELSTLQKWLQALDLGILSPDKKKAAAPLVSSILLRLNAMIELGLGYLSLKRSIPTLSSGEKQRIRIASQLSCPLKDLIYILDEPCKGLHPRDIYRIIRATNKLVENGNSVISIEHNQQYISAATHVLELGPEGGPGGGYLIRNEKAAPVSRTVQLFKAKRNFTKFFAVDNIHYRTLHNQAVRFPAGGITCITGVSGSGKTTLAAVIRHCFQYQSDTSLGKLQTTGAIRRISQMNQSPIGKTPRSTVVSYLDIFTEIRTLFSKTESAKSQKITAALFRTDQEGGRCEACKGTGLQKLEFNFLPDAYIQCPECNGKRYKEEVLAIQYNGKTISDVLETPVSELIEIFHNNKKIYTALDCMIQLGLGYLKLGQRSMNLSGGEAQRVKLAKALSSSSCNNTLYILDEPTSGLSGSDIDNFSKILLELQNKGATILVIEHNTEFIASIADYVIDLGTEAGAAGGKIVAMGTPEEVFDNPSASLFDLKK